MDDKRNEDAIIIIIITIIIVIMPRLLRNRHDEAGKNGSRMHQMRPFELSLHCFREDMRRILTEEEREERD